MRKIFLLSVVVLLTNFLKSQSLEINWSEQLIFNNKLDGFPDAYLGTNDQFVYVKFSNLNLRGKKHNKKIKLLAFDKKTMKKAGEAKLKGYEKEKNDLIYVKTFVFKKVIYVIWRQEKKHKNEYFAESFDERLKEINKLTKIYEFVEEKGKHDNVAILGNINASKVLILKEFGITKDDENLKIEYKMLNADLKFGSVHQVTFPIQFSKKRRGLFSSSNRGFKVNYELGDDGFIYVRDLVKMDEEERKLLKKHESSSYTYFAQINPEKGTIRDYKVKYDSKNTFFTDYVIDKGKIKLYGFFSDLDKDVKGNDTHGIFFVLIDNSSFKVSTMHFEYFDKKFLDQLYAKDPKDQKQGKGALKGKKAKESDNTSIDDYYVIEQTISDGPNLVLFCSMMNNYSTQTCNGNGVCRTNYYCKKKNVTVFKLNQDGKFLWAKNLDRVATYGMWDVYDVKVIKSKNNYVALYGSDKELNGKRKKLKSILNGNLQYAMFSITDGSFKIAEYEVNEKNAKRKDKKLVTINSVEVLDSKMYTFSSRVRAKPGLYFTMLLPPVYYFLKFNANMYKGKGNMGSIGAKG